MLGVFGEVMVVVEVFSEVIVEMEVLGEVVVVVEVEVVVNFSQKVKVQSKTKL